MSLLHHPRLHFACLLLALPLGSILPQSPGKIDPGRIQAVTVYSDRALVSRVLRVSTNARGGSVIFRELPANIIQNSLSASAMGADITGVSLLPIVKGQKRRWKNHPLKLNLDKIDNDLAVAGDRLTTHQEQLKVLSSFGRLTTAATDRQSRGGSIDIASWTRALDFLEARRNVYLERIRLAKKRIKELKADRRVAHAAFQQVARSHKKAAVQARVSFANKKRPRVEIILQYMVSGVSWRGFYDLRGSSEDNKFKLVAHANIRQSTGEDWRDVRVTLSSARPSVGTSPGVLQPWRVSSASLEQNRVRASGKRSRGSGFGEGERNDTTGAISDSSETSTFSIRLPGRETILSNNSAHEITLNTSTLKGKVSHVALPAISEFVFLRARLDNTSGMPIFPGNINVFLDGNFIGKSRLGGGVAAGEQFDLFLGPDQRMRLKRSLVRGDVEGTGVFTKTVKVVNQWRIEIGNYTRKTRTVIIYDQYPVPADPNISTAYLGSTVEAKANANGILRWQIKIEPGKKRKFDFTYSMSVPTEMWNRLVERPEPAKEAAQDDLQNMPVRRPQKRQYNLERLFK